MNNPSNKIKLLKNEALFGHGLIPKELVDQIFRMKKMQWVTFIKRLEAPEPWVVGLTLFKYELKNVYSDLVAVHFFENDLAGRLVEIHVAFGPGLQSDARYLKFARKWEQGDKPFDEQEELLKLVVDECYGPAYGVHIRIQNIRGPKVKGILTIVPKPGKEEE